MRLLARPGKAEASVLHTACVLTHAAQRSGALSRRRRHAGGDVSELERAGAEVIEAAGEVKIPPQTIIDGSVHAGLDVCLRDLREWHALRAWCKNCSHHAPVKATALIRRYGKDALFSTVERALLCTSCDRGGPVRLEIHKLPRN
ncbi:hypothetical protein EJ077_21205 [Mesorhizobium sp. M8A.F.Ca.ET.057.01.1.1]|nr:hypothetical protein EJ077_21205 [Mesorhizobium sp. M8A.F.Ca.ET.057.01.1.1]RWE42845.1 MAG: hypothetical protein EOS80_24295 [Mesorhizobium sp.]